MQRIENEYFRAEISEVGAVLTSFVAKKNGQELLWQKDPRYWDCQDVVIFPQIGKAPNLIEGESYDCPTRHGFTRISRFEVKAKSANSVTLELRDNSETRKTYPFSFLLEITHTLAGSKLIREAKITNYSAKMLPFSLGFHQAFKANYDGSGSIHFDKAPHYYYPMRDGVLKAKEPSIYQQNEVLRSDLWRDNETWVLPNDAHYQILVKTGLGYCMKYHFDSPEIAIWRHSSGGDFLCVEPWWGFSTYEGMPKELSKRQDENLVHDEKTFRLEIEFNED